MAKTLHNQALSAELAEGLAPLNRRGFLKAGLLAAVSTSTVLTMGCSSEVSVDPALKVLSPSQQALFARLVEILLPTKGTVMADTSTVPVLANVDHLLAGLEPKVRDDLGAAMTLFEYGSLVLGGHFSRFTRLDDAAAIAYIDDWQNGNAIQRGVAATLKRLVYASYWRDEKTWAPVDYDGPVTVRWGLPSLGNAPLPAE